MAIKFFNNVAVDSDVLYVDAVNNEVGIGTTNPLAKLQVNTSGSDISAQLGLDLFGSFKLGDVTGNYAGRGIFYNGFPGSEDVQILTSTFRISGSGSEGIEGASNGDVYLRSQFGIVATIDASTNNFGIGTTSPNYKLQVNGDFAAEDNIYLTDAGTVRGKFELNSSDRDDVDIKAVSLGSNMKFFTVDTERMRIDSSGNVGIGTTSPSAKLQISTSMSSSPTSNIFLDVDGANTNGGGGSIIFGTSATAGTTSLYNAKITGTRVAGQGGDSELGFWTTLVSDSTSPQQRMTITKEGNIGIGTTSPVQKLDVAGSVRVQDRLYTNANATNTVGIIGKATVNGWASRYDSNNANFSGFYFDGNHHSIILGRNSGGTIVNYIHASGSSYFNGGNVGIGTTSPALKLEVDGSPYMSFAQAGTRRSFIQHADSGDYLKLASEYGGISFFTGTGGTETEKMTILSDGNIGIGTTSPQSKLHVANGTLRTWTPIGGTTAIFESTQNNRSFVTITGANESELWFGGATTQNQGRIRYENNNNTMEFWTNLNPRMYINSSGNVGIGTSSPTYLLDVNEDDNVVAFRVTGGGGGAAMASFVRDVGSTGASVNINAQSNFPQIQFVSTGNTFSIGADSSGDFKISDNTSIGTNDRIIIDVNGNFGIKTTTLAHDLNIGQLSDTETSAGIFSNSQSRFYLTTDSSATCYLHFGDSQFATQNTRGLIEYGVNVTPNLNYFRFRVNFSDVMRLGLSPTGAVRAGIGTSTPNSMLQVNGGVQLANDTDTASASKVGTLRYYTSGNNSYVDMCMQTGASTYAWVNIVQNSW
jgi:hypothetical protein